jgi:hypothetical protein
MPPVNHPIIRKENQTTYVENAENVSTRGGADCGMSGTTGSEGAMMLSVLIMY